MANNYRAWFSFKLFRNCFALACLLLAWTNGGFILASGNAGSGNAAAPANRLPACPVSFLMDAVADARGNVWVAAEAGGVWKLEAGTWRAMHREPGFPHHECYAIAEDLQGRIWVGTDNQGWLSGTARHGRLTISFPDYWEKACLPSG